MHDFFIFEPGY
jgi:hypothetical protein